MAYIVQVAENKKTQVSITYTNQIRNRIRSEMPKVHITRVEIVQNNKFLHAAFQIRKAQHQLTRGSCPTEDLYHATSEQNVKSILKSNLDWRRVQRSRFGVGVSFSFSPEYANKFCNDNNGVQRAFIICEVLTGNVLRVGQNYSPYPRTDIDTYRSKSNMVVVKFEDDTFYPKCVVYYRTQAPRPSRPIHTYAPSYSDSDSDSYDYDYYSSD